jgi:hypothetical protein
MKTSICILALLAATSLAQVTDRAPLDLDWLREEVREGALAYSDNGWIFLCELSTGKTETIGPGISPEFSPDSSKLVWIEGEKLRGRARGQDPSIHTLVSSFVDPGSGVHWIAADEVAVVLRNGSQRGWFGVKLNGASRELPDLSKLGAGADADIRRLGDAWIYASGTKWRSSDERSGTLKGGLARGISPDGKSIIVFDEGSEKTRFEPIVEGGPRGEVAWPYAGFFGNPRWSSNDPRFITGIDSKSGVMMVMKVGDGTCTRLGELGSKGLSGDFTVGDGKGTAWPERSGAISGPPRITSAAAGASTAVTTVATAVRPIVTPAATNATPGRLVLTKRWPGSGDGLVWVWADAEKQNRVLDATTKKPRLCDGRLRGWAQIGPDYDLWLGAGSFVANQAGPAIVAGCQESNELAVEVMAYIGDTSKNGVLASFAASRVSRNFTLSQQGDRLLFNLRTSQTGLNPEEAHELSALGANAWTHILVSFRRSEIAAYVNGKTVFRTTGDFGDLSTWEASHTLSFGNDVTGMADWNGSMESMAVFSRFVGETEAKHHYRLADRLLKRHKGRTSVTVQAKVIEATAAPDPADLDGARQCLGEFKYERVSGNIQGTFVATHWVILDGRRSAAPEVGRTYRLTLEPFESHPQLTRIPKVGSQPDSLRRYHVIGW